MHTLLDQSLFIDLFVEALVTFLPILLFTNFASYEELVLLIMFYNSQGTSDKLFTQFHDRQCASGLVLRQAQDVALAAQSNAINSLSKIRLLC